MLYNTNGSLTWACFNYSSNCFCFNDCFRQV